MVRPGRRVGQAGHLDQPFHAQPQPPPGGHQHLHAGRPAQQLGHHPRRVAELLQVVERQQQLPPGQVVGEQLQGVAGDRQRHPQRAGEAGDDQVARLLGPGGAGPHEGHEHRAVTVADLA